MWVFVDEDDDGAYDVGEVVTGSLDGYVLVLSELRPDSSYAEDGFEPGWNVIVDGAFVSLDEIRLSSSLATVEGYTIGGTVSEAAAHPHLRVTLLTIDEVQPGGDRSARLVDAPIGSTWTLTPPPQGDGDVSTQIVVYVDSDGDGSSSDAELEGRRGACLEDGSAYDDVFLLSMAWASVPESLATALDDWLREIRPGWRAEGWDEVTREYVVTPEQAANLEIDVSCRD